MWPSIVSIDCIERSSSFCRGNLSLSLDTRVQGIESVKKRRNFNRFLTNSISLEIKREFPPHPLDHPYKREIRWKFARRNGNRFIVSFSLFDPRPFFLSFFLSPSNSLSLFSSQFVSRGSVRFEWGKKGGAVRLFLFPFLSLFLLLLFLPPLFGKRLVIQTRKTLRGYFSVETE